MRSRSSPRVRTGYTPLYPWTTERATRTVDITWTTERAQLTHRRSRRERRQLPPRLRPSVSGGGQHHFWHAVLLLLCPRSALAPATKLGACSRLRSARPSPGTLCGIRAASAAACSFGCARSWQCLDDLLLARVPLRMLICPPLRLTICLTLYCSLAAQCGRRISERAMADFDCPMPAAR